MSKIKKAEEIAQMLVDNKTSWWGSLTDWDVLGNIIQPVDVDAEWVTGRDNYTFWFLLGEYFLPSRILEIGTRFGYGLWAVVKGAGVPVDQIQITVYDFECDGEVEPLKVCEQWLRARGISDLHFHREDTQKLDKLEVPQLVDFAVVDADHSEEGAYHDCCLAWECLRPGGVLVVDDTLPGPVRVAAERFAQEKGVEWGYIPSLRGIHIMLKPE